MSPRREIRIAQNALDRAHRQRIGIAEPGVLNGEVAAVGMIGTAAETIILETAAVEKVPSQIVGIDQVVADDLHLQ